MDYMLHIGLLAHKYLIYSYIAVLFFHIFKLVKVEDVTHYRRFMLIYNPMLTLPTLGGVIFSGLVMFTALDFHFDTAIVIMIIAAIGMIVHEFKRAKELKTTLKEEFGTYRKRALRYLATNLFLVFLTTFLAIKFS